MTSLAAAVAVVVAGQVLYHATLRGVDASQSAFGLVTVAYAVALPSAIVVGLTSHQIHMGLSRSTVLRGILLGVAVALVEIGYVFAYRRGLSVATGGLGVLALSTLALTPVGVIGYHEQISAKTVGGALITVLGVWLMRR